MRSRPELSHSAEHTARNCDSDTPHTSATIAGVYREKWRRNTWNTQRGSVSVGSDADPPRTPTSSAELNNPSRSSVSWKSSRKIVDAFVYATTYSRKYLSSERM